jgi:membrane associated rhomboid family serine protease
VVIPIADRNPTRRTPWVTRGLVLANIVVFAALTPWASSACAQVGFFSRWAVVPLEILQGSPLSDTQQAGTAAAECGLPTAGGKDVYAAILVSMFLHGGWLHLLLNMLYLWIFGNNVEDRFGHLGFLGFYLLSGAVATLAFVAANTRETMTLVGASGAIAGVLGAYLVLFPRARVYASVPFLFFLVLPLPAAFVLVLWFVGQVAALRVGDLAGTGVAYLAHVAGFVAGIGLTVALGVRGAPPPAPRTRRRPRRPRRRGRRGRRGR